MNKTKLIWEYRGANAKGIAEHQVIHLNEYCAINEIIDTSTGIEKFQNNVWFAFIELDKKQHAQVAKDLKPRFLKSMKN